MTHGGGDILFRHDVNGGSILLSYKRANASLSERKEKNKALIKKKERNLIHKHGGKNTSHQREVGVVLWHLYHTTSGIEFA